MPPKIKARPAVSTLSKVTPLVHYRRGSFWVHGQRAIGVNTFLDTKVLEPIPPGESKEAAIHGATSPVVSVELEHTKENTKLSSYQKSLTGPRKGKYIHAQIEKLVKKFKQKQGLNTSKRQKGVCVHPVARAMYQGLQRMSLSVCSSEVGVCATRRKVATQADLVCRHTKTGRYVLVELKTGYRDALAYRAPKYRLRFDKGVLVSEQQRHFLQLFVTTILFNKTHPNKIVGDSILLQAPSHTTAVAYTLPTWVLELRPTLERLLS